PGGPDRRLRLERLRRGDQRRSERLVPPFPDAGALGDADGADRRPGASARADIAQPACRHRRDGVVRRARCGVRGVGVLRPFGAADSRQCAVLWHPTRLVAPMATTQPVTFLLTTPTALTSLICRQPCATERHRG